MRRGRLLLLLVIIAGIGATCVAVIAYPFLGPVLFDRLSTLLPRSECSDLDGYLLAGLPSLGAWEAQPHTSPETYLEPPLVTLEGPEERAVGRLYLPVDDTLDGWAVLRVYCLGNDMRARSFYLRPGFAGYVDALATPEGKSLAELDLGWAPESQVADQQIARCRRSLLIASPFLPAGASPFEDEVACGTWARYGRFVIAFELHLQEDEMRQELVEDIIAQLESRLNG